MDDIKRILEYARRVCAEALPGTVGVPKPAVRLLADPVAQEAAEDERGVQEGA